MSVWQLKKDADQLTGKMEKDIVTEAERLDIKDKAPMVLVELLFDENIMQQIKRFRTLFLRVRTWHMACCVLTIGSSYFTYSSSYG